MLTNISIKNYALIDYLNVDLHQGLNVITGETGAGKSIIIDALTLLLGYRANKSNIREGTKKMTVQGLFEITDNKNVKAVLEKFDIDFEEDQLILSRMIDQRGKNVCRANGVIITVAQLRMIGNDLIDIHSQHEHQSLFQRDNHRKLLDALGGSESEELLEKASEYATILRETVKKIRHLENDARALERQKEMDAYELKDIQSANLKQDEDESLENEKRRLENSEQLFTNSNEAYELLNGNEKDYENGLLTKVSELRRRIEELANIDVFFESYQTTLDSVYHDLENLSMEIANYIDTVDFEVDRLDEVEKRLSIIDQLKRKYGGSIQEIISYGDNLAHQLEGLSNRDEQIENLKIENKKCFDEYLVVAEQLHELRIKSAHVLKEGLERELKDLSMEKAKVEVSVERERKLVSPTGQDTVEFLISTNPGTSPKPLRKIASGGEMSRIMLSIKCIFGDHDRIQTMIFDEIDTGISGRTAQAVAEKIFTLSQTHQIICITHLPQITAMADNHFYVEKRADDQDTQVNFKQLDEAQRTEELARMLSGAEMTQKTLEHAYEMLEMTKAIKLKRKDYYGNT